MPNVNTVRCEIWYFRQNRQPGRLLDYGFGYGQELIYFADKGYDVYGLDIAPSAKSRFDDYLRTNRPDLVSQIKTQLLDRSASCLPYDDNFFDFIHSNQVIHSLASEDAVSRLLSEWHRILRAGGLLMFSCVGPTNTQIVDAVHLGGGVYECDYQVPTMAQPDKRRAFLARDESHLRSLCHMFEIHEIGWFSNHYCGIDGFHWQVLAKKP